LIHLSPPPPSLLSDFARVPLSDFIFNLDMLGYIPR